MKLNEQKLLQQKQIVQKWQSANAKGTVVAPTGFGKSYVGILIVQSMNDRFPDRTTMVIVPTIELKKQWDKQVIALGLLNVTVVVINTAISKPSKCHLLILDEVHRYAALTFRNVFDQVKYNFILGLTATIKRSDNKHYLLEQYCPVIFKMKLSEAREKKYVSEFKVFNYGFDLDVEQVAEYEVADRRYNYYFSWFGHNFHSAMSCCNDKDYARSYASDRDVDYAEVMKNAVQFLRYMQKRKQVLLNNPQKLAIIAEIMSLYKQKAIIFSETIGFADAIAKTVPNCSSLHTGTPAKERKRILEEFASGSSIQAISTAKMYDEGIDIPGIEMAVIASGTGSKRQSTQRMGRAIRFVEGKSAIIINLFARNTQEERWVSERTTGVSPVWISRIEDIATGGGSAQLYGVTHRLELF